jgi:hypothetical protein
LLRTNPGAQRASTTRIGFAIVVAALAMAVSAPAAGASSAPVTSSADGAVALTLTATDAPWLAVEQFDLNLVNCTRTGGWVLTDGTCKGYGSGHYSAYVKPLRSVAGISNLVSRPYAKLLAIKNLCTHFANGSPGDRLRRAGYTRPTWGENIGCRDGYSTANAAVLASHLKFQSEKSTNGGHWRNIKNANYLWIGIGVWRYGSRTRLVNDFYR